MNQVAAPRASGGLIECVLSRIGRVTQVDAAGRSIGKHARHQWIGTEMRGDDQDPTTGVPRLLQMPERLVESEVIRHTGIRKTRPDHVHEETKLVRGPIQVQIDKPLPIEPDGLHVPGEMDAEGQAGFRNGQRDAGEQIETLPIESPGSPQPDHYHANGGFLADEAKRRLTPGADDEGSISQPICRHVMLVKDGSHLRRAGSRADRPGYRCLSS
jgi:hypothetical protein